MPEAIVPLANSLGNRWSFRARLAASPISVLTESSEWLTKLGMRAQGARRVRAKRRAAVDEREREREQALALRHFVEDMGLHFEYGGMPRMAGRVLGHLLVCDPPHQSAEELARSIGASRASVSTTTRLLIQTGLVERQVVPGKRRDQFRVRPEAFGAQLLDRVRLVTMFRQVLERGLAALEGETEERRQRVRGMYEMYSWMERELPRLFERYQKEVVRNRG
jgi:DNA-binding transcriptional regulator GbsR (MarR family)